jgi:hypothetical protein
LSRRGVLALSVLAHAMMVEAESLDERAERIAPQCDLDTEVVLRAARRVQDQFAQAATYGR